MKRLLKNFPVKSLDPKKLQEQVAEIKEEIITRDSKTQEQIAESDIINFNESAEAPQFKIDELLGDLLFFLRESKAISTLMICRQIDNIEVKDGVAELSSENGDISELISLERHKIEMKKFFKGKGLGFKIKEKIIEKRIVDLLKEIFGDKLIVE